MRIRRSQPRNDYFLHAPHPCLISQISNPISESQRYYFVEITFFSQYEYSRFKVKRKLTGGEIINDFPDNFPLQKRQDKSLRASPSFTFCFLFHKNKLSRNYFICIFRNQKNSQQRSQKVSETRRQLTLTTRNVTLDKAVLFIKILNLFATAIYSDTQKILHRRPNTFRSSEQFFGSLTHFFARG